MVLLLAPLGAYGEAAKADAKPKGSPTRFSLDANPGVSIPLGDADDYFSLGYDFNLKFKYAILSWFSPFIGLDFSYVSLSQGNETLAGLVLFSGRGGLALSLPIGDRLTLGISGSGGLGLGSQAKDSVSALYFWDAGATLGFRLSPAWALDLSGSYSVAGSVFTGITAGLTIRLTPGTDKASNARVAIKVDELKPIFPVFYSYYDTNSFGTVEIKNGEDKAIHDVKISFQSGQFMSQPKVCTVLPTLGVGASTKVPLYALFGEDILSVTALGDLKAQIIVDYDLLGAERRVTLPVALILFHRNNMNWVDDRRAAAFVSPTDPAALWFAKSVGSVVTDRMRAGVSKNLQLAMGLFEAERIFGINYVIDPSSSYADKVSDETDSDFLQYPFQTLTYRGGDCDDLSILMCSMLQSLGVQTAFITIPGHIYMAFKLETTAEEARKTFYDPSLLIFRGNEAWVPLEITMVRDGFAKAWRVGAKEWVDNNKTGAAKFYPINDAWKIYHSVGIPGITARFELASDSEVMQAFDSALDRFVVRQIDSQVRTVAMEPTKPQAPEVENALGIVYGKNGMLKEAWAHLTVAAKGGVGLAWTNLANVAYLRKDYELAKNYYDYALKLDANDNLALLGRARCSYELEHFDDSDADYEALKAKDPELASAFGYLASILGGTGRAWSLADRMSTVRWREAELGSKLVLAPMDGPGSGTAPAKAAAPTKTATPAKVATTTAALPPSIQATAPEDKDLSQATRAAEQAAQAKALEAKALAEAAEVSRAKAEAQRQAEMLKAAETQKQEEAARLAKAAEDAKAAQAAAALAAQQAEQAAKSAKASSDAAAAAAAAKASADAKAAADAAALAKAAADAEAAAAAKVAADAKAATEKAKADEAARLAAAAADAAAKKAAADAAATAQAQPAAVAVAAVTVTATPSAKATSPATTAVSMPTATTQLSGAAGTKFVEDFATFKPAVGTWSLGKVLAVHLEPEEYYAKMVLPVALPEGASRYTFAAKSTGYAWVGFGLHFADRGAITHKGYGEGHSFLVWLTSDPVHLGSADTHLQLYRSDEDTELYLLADVVVPESIFDRNEVTIEADPAASTVRVFLNGQLRMEQTGLPGLAGGECLVIRSLDKSEFYSFQAEELK